jgi:hypothetical protein
MIVNLPAEDRIEIAGQEDVRARIHGSSKCDFEELHRGR